MENRIAHTLGRALCLLLIGGMSYAEMVAQDRPAPSWRDQGFAMLSAGKLDSAEYFLEKWVEADPRDESSWYNLACVYALDGQSEKALDAFESSVAAGWTDAGHAMRDSDLESVREDSRFVAAIERVRDGENVRGVKGFERRFVETRTIATYIAILPEDYATSNREYPICVILHGSGSTETGHGTIADIAGREDVIYIAPRALNARVVGDGLGYTAWPIEEIDSTDPIYRRSAPNYADLVRACVEDAREQYRTTDEKVMIIGHSQGAAFSWITAASHPDIVGSILAYAGYFPDRYSTNEIFEEVLDEEISVTLIHGSEDRSVSIEESRTMEALLKEEGIDVTAHYLDGVSHSIESPVRELMKEWIKEQTRK